MLRNTRLLGLLGLAALLPQAAFAQIISAAVPSCDFRTGRFSAACIPSFIAYLIAFVFSLLGMFFLINVMIAGYQIALKGVTGDDQAGKNRLRWSVIGLILAICSFVILDFILSVITDRL